MAYSHSGSWPTGALTRTTVTHGLETGTLRGVSVTVDISNYAERNILVTCFISGGGTNIQDADRILFTDYVLVNQPAYWQGQYDIQGSEIVVASAISFTAVTLYLATDVSHRAVA
jgi:hypothetical protein